MSDDSAPSIHNTVTGDVSGSIMAGRIEGGVHQHLHATRPAVGLPYRAGTLPSRAASFQDRAAAQQLADLLSHRNTAVLTGVVSGLGGVGKTQLARDYAESAWAAGAVDLLVWVTAGSREAIVSSYARLVAALTGIEDANSDHGAQRMVQWLANTSARWLVVLDDVQSPRDLQGLCPPGSLAGRTVITTRRRDAALRADRRQVIEIGVFTEVEAHAYLTAAFAERSCLLSGAAELACELGHLPLALAQAAAYALDRSLSCAAYLERFADRQHKLAALLPEVEGLPDEHRTTVATTWSLSVEHADRLAPVGVASPLLEVASFLDANGIPADVFTTQAVTDLLSSRLGRVVTAEEARDGLGCLRRLSLITVNPDSSSRSVRMHALVQRATRDNMLMDHVPAVVHAVAHALVEAWPEIEEIELDSVLGQVLRANSEALNAAGGEHLWESDGHQVLFHTGRSLGENGLVIEAIDHFQRLHAISATRLGVSHLVTLAARGNLAHWRGEAGDLTAAITALEALRVDHERVLGSDHLDALTTRSNLAHWRGFAGDAAWAAVAFEELLVDQARVLGPDHVDTLTTRSNLASWRWRAGDLAGAVTVFAELLEDRVRVLGPGHLSTMHTRTNLASLRILLSDDTPN